MTWNDLLAKWNNDELKLLTASVPVNDDSIKYVTTTGIEIGISRVVRLINFIEIKQILDIYDDKKQSNSHSMDAHHSDRIRKKVTDADELCQILQSQCSEYGRVNKIVIPSIPFTDDNVSTNVSNVSDLMNISCYSHAFIEMSTVDEAVRLVIALKGMTFDDRVLDAKFYSEKEFLKGNYNYIGLNMNQIVITKNGCYLNDDLISIE